ncbi:FeoA family protein [Bradyrhizobium sp. 26S5]|jgi:ferrous iron transport protein A|uniref:FeoA family protein n=1 Tax=Bradyrhizobium sp. 26S5 TaxID=3139729 RepID=UPI0030CB29A8
MTGDPNSSQANLQDGFQDIRLGHADRGFVGKIIRLDALVTGSSLSPQELEQRLVEMGFVEGARVEILHEGTIRRDPIAVRVDNITIALRRSEAMAVIVE